MQRGHLPLFFQPPGRKPARGLNPILYDKPSDNVTIYCQAYFRIPKCRCIILIWYRFTWEIANIIMLKCTSNNSTRYMYQSEPERSPYNSQSIKKYVRYVCYNSSRFLSRYWYLRPASMKSNAWPWPVFPISNPLGLLKDPFGRELGRSTDVGCALFSSWSGLRMCRAYAWGHNPVIENLNNVKPSETLGETDIWSSRIYKITVQLQIFRTEHGIINHAMPRKLAIKISGQRITVRKICQNTVSNCTTQNDPLGVIFISAIIMKKSSLNYEAYRFHQMALEKIGGSKMKKPPTLQSFNSKVRTFQELHAAHLSVPPLLVARYNLQR